MGEGDVLEVVVDETLRKSTEQKGTCLRESESIFEVFLPMDNKPGDIIGMQKTPLDHQFAAYFPKGSMPGDTVPFIVHDSSIIRTCESPCCRLAGNACREICAC